MAQLKSQPRVESQTDLVLGLTATMICFCCVCCGLMDLSPPILPFLPSQTSLSPSRPPCSPSRPPFSPPRPPCSPPRPPCSSPTSLFSSRTSLFFSHRLRRLKGTLPFFRYIYSHTGGQWLWHRTYKYWILEQGMEQQQVAQLTVDGQSDERSTSGYNCVIISKLSYKPQLKPTSRRSGNFLKLRFEP